MRNTRFSKALALVLTFATMLSCMTGLVLPFGASAVTKTSNYLLISGSEMAGASEVYGISTKSTANGVWSFTTTNNDPYVNLAAISGVGDTILQTYPYMVVRYKTSQFTSMEIFTGHPGTAHRRVSMPAPATNGGWGCLFYDFSQFPTQYKSWLRLEPATASGISMEIAEVVLFKNLSDVTTYHNVYATAGGSGTPYVLTFNDFGYHGNTNTGRNNASADVSGITEVRPDNNDAMFNEGGYFVRLTAGGADPYVVFDANNTGVHNAIATYNKVAIRYRAPASVNGQQMKIYFAWDESKTASATIVGDNQWQWAFFDRKATDVFRLDFVDKATAGQFVDVAEVYFYNNDADVYNAQVGANSYRNNPGSTWFHGGMYMLHKSGKTYFQSVGTVAGGTYKGYQKSATGAAFAVGNQSVSVVGRTLYIQSAYHSAHNESTVTTVSASTCTTAGSTQYSCSLCGEVQRTVSSGLAAHTPGAAATCTTAQVCTVCNTTIQAALGHTIVVDPYVAPTATTTGLTEGKHCSVCKTVLVAQEVIPTTAPDPNAPTVTVGTVSGAPGETVTVAAVLKNNPGIFSFTFSIDYDTTRLKLTDASVNIDALGGSETVASRIVWLGDDADSTFNGEIVYLTFEILAGAPAG